MAPFELHREEDETGISGTGVVAEGVMFKYDKIAISWNSVHTSVAVYDDMNTVEAIHGHNGKTKIVWK